MSKPKALFIITGDPRSSAKPAEAIRIAAGVGTWKKAEISVYLRDTAVLALSEYADEFIDEDNYTRYFPIVGEFGRPIYVQKNAPLLNEIGDSPLKFEEIDDAQLAELAASSNYVLRF
jgi:sulfur relay (sulfurtransferase) DsrF/TusC family protein